MATKTYLELINLVLQNLREDSVATVNATTYSTLVGTWVNKAKYLVENATRWRRLVRAVSFSISAGVQTYDLSSASIVGSGNELNDRAVLLRSVINEYLPMAYDVTPGDPFQLIDKPYEYIVENRELLAANPSNQSKPIYFALSKDEDGVTLDLYEVPTSTRNWKIYFHAPQNDFTTGTENIKVPYQPVVDLATLWALNERGEEIGEPGTTVEGRVHAILADAVALNGTDDQLAFARG